MMKAKELLLTVFFITAINLAIFAKILPSFFFADDFFYIWLTKATGIAEFMNKTFALSFLYYLRPIPALASMIMSNVFGLAPQGYYCVNFLITTINCLLVFTLAIKITERKSVAFLSSILFAVFPAYWEAIGWAGPINTLLMTTFYLSSLIGFVAFDKNGKVGNLILSAFFFGLALFTYEAALTLLILLIAFDILKNNAALRGKDLLKYLPFLAVLAIYLPAYALKIALGPKTAAFSSYYPGPHFVLNWLDYVATLLIPFITTYKLSSLLPGSIIGLINISKMVIMAILPVALFMLLKKSRSLFFFALWPFVTVLPFTFFTYPNVSRYLYLPSVGFVILISAIMIEFHSRAASSIRKNFIAGSIAVLVFCYLIVSVGYQTVFFNKKEVRRSILSDLRSVMPEIGHGSTLNFSNLPIREDEITYMVYLWFGDDYKIRVTSKGSMPRTGVEGTSYYFTYKDGHIRRT